jgi:tRNA(adenine34) deaminase
VEIDLYSNDRFMAEALKQAQIAFEEGEVPVGAVVVANNKIIARGFNQTEKLHDVTAHAEMIALTSAFDFMGAKYLPDCTLYVTLEPCNMCGGALYWSQIGKIVFGASDSKRGYRATSKKIIHPKTEVISGVLETECKALIDAFFERIRK